MYLDGRDYNQVFDETLEKLKYESEPDELQRQLEHLEWVHWQSIKNVITYSTMILTGVFIWPLAWVLNDQQNWVFNLVVLIAWIAMSLVGYWMFRFVFWYCVSRHIRFRVYAKS